ncbi:hypothetical protein TSTA_040090 [Talaromyces stipitatus ATCC 10500]|uniref:Uncharacterized protein n=1 Tax=Talaromyces stipitatus (strain ATCC 10500 / CBS 375.48 / QM 6759 / NRRL 1006) TaxID=441959 RepID=B8M472_TALSN|nr:uncharacterized protein TSTA_040090 [Talaromyces stipitatus ATCC 10500]EED20815.1 hypothetical protein TSTA_040090 [Talaromyces stipitatus ATCC 10500]
MSITSPSSHHLGDENIAEERRLRALMVQHPPQIPYYGVYVRQASGQAGAHEALGTKRHYRPNLRGQTSSAGYIQKVKAIRAKVQKGLDSVSDQHTALNDQIQELKGELENDFSDLDRLVASLTVHWVRIENDIAREYGYEQADDDQLKILSLAYTDAEEQWYRTHLEI